MKYINLTISSMVACFVGMLALHTSCEADYTETENALFISEANGLEKYKKVMVDSEGGQATVSVTLAREADQDVTARLAVDESLIQEFNERNHTEYQLLPSEFYSLSQEKVTIRQGMQSASPVSLKLNPLSKELEDSGVRYAVPVVLKDAEGINMLVPSSKLLYVIDRVIITSVPKLTSSTPAFLNMRKPSYVLKNWSFEFRVNMSMLGTKVGQMNNQGVFGAWGPTGAGNEIYMRFGDAMIEGNRLQVKAYGTQVNCNKIFEANKWYHIAVTSDGSKMKVYIDGELEATMATPKKEITLESPFRVCDSGLYLLAEVMMSEFRFWTKEITQAQIKENQFITNPKSEGLEGYWKMNEGTGSTLNDATGNGNTGTIRGRAPWIEGIRSDGKDKK